MLISPLTLPAETIHAQLAEFGRKQASLEPDRTRFRCAAVLLALLEDQGEWRLLFTRRTDTVQEHKGQVSFPGGACEPGDESLVHTALREAYEEVGLQPSQVKVLGSIRPLVSITSFVIEPVVAVIPWPLTLILSPAEVVRTFTVPLGWLADSNNREERDAFHPVLNIPHKVVYYRPYDGETIWGLTARLVVDFLRVLELIH